MHRVDLLWNEAVGRHRGTTDRPSELAWAPSLIPLAVGTSEAQLVTGQCEYLVFTAGDGTWREMFIPCTSERQH